MESCEDYGFKTQSKKAKGPTREHVHRLPHCGGSCRLNCFPFCSRIIRSPAPSDRANRSGTTRRGCGGGGLYLEPSILIHLTGTLHHTISRGLWRGDPACFCEGRYKYFIYLISWSMPIPIPMYISYGGLAVIVRPTTSFARAAWHFARHSIPSHIPLYLFPLPSLSVSDSPPIPSTRSGPDANPRHTHALRLLRIAP
jgi:hypothetical protein